MTKLFLTLLALGTLYITTLPSTVRYPDTDSGPAFFVAGSIVHAAYEPAKPQLSTEKKAVVNHIPDAGKMVGMTEAELKRLILKYAGPLHVREDVMFDVVDCEALKHSDGSYDVRGQSGHIRADGTREDSWGLAQINLPSWPRITRAEAQDPEFAIRFMAEQFSAGNASAWTCWRLIRE